MEGNSDELDVPIKHCFHDSEFSKANNLGSFNSLQWGRVLLQAAHYIYIYLQCCGTTFGDELNIIVPTGAAGNLAGKNFLSNGLRFMNVHFMFFKAGFLAADMGFAIKLVGMTQ